MPIYIASIVQPSKVGLKCAAPQLGRCNRVRLRVPRLYCCPGKPNAAKGYRAGSASIGLRAAKLLFTEVELPF